MRAPKVEVARPANKYAADGETIMQFSHPNGGGLVSFQATTDGRLVINVYRHDAAVEVRESAKDVLRVYHRTTPEAAKAILEAGRFLSKEQGDVCVSTVRGGMAAGYGRAVVVLHLPFPALRLDDEFPDGERHYRVDAANIQREHIVGVTVDGEETG